jgi:hypothetical protein
MTTQAEANRAIAATPGELIYRFEAQLSDMYPVGIFPEGIRFHNEFDGRIVDGPFAGGRIFGLDQFLLRSDGVGEIDAPEIVEAGERRLSLHVRGYVVPPEAMVMPPLEVVASPGFAFPDVEFRVTGSALIRTAAPGCERLNRTVAVIEGKANLATGSLRVEARAAGLPMAASRR